MQLQLNTRINVLDNGWIELQDMMPHPDTGQRGDLAIVNAARTSFLGESKGDEADKKLLFYLLRHHHTTPFEMIEFKFRVYAPLLVWWQWVRHRSASYNLQSGRYTPFEENDFYWVEPCGWRKQSASNKQGSADENLTVEEGIPLSTELARHYALSYRLYEQTLSAGVAKEQARLFLPGFAAYYQGIVKVDGKNLLDFIRLRNAPDAQYEIRCYASAIYDFFIEPALPWTCEAFERYVIGQGAE